MQRRTCQSAEDRRHVDSRSDTQAGECWMEDLVNERGLYGRQWQANVGEIGILEREDGKDNETL